MINKNQFFLSREEIQMNCNLQTLFLIAKNTVYFNCEYVSLITKYNYACALVYKSEVILFKITVNWA